MSLFRLEEYDINPDAIAYVGPVKDVSISSFYKQFEFAIFFIGSSVLLIGRTKQMEPEMDKEKETAKLLKEVTELRSRVIVKVGV